MVKLSLSPTQRPIKEYLGIFYLAFSSKLNSDLNKNFVREKGLKHWNVLVQMLIPYEKKVLTQFI